MTFDAFETADGQPIELVSFFNGTLSFRYTNAVRQITAGALPYFPLAYTRTEPRLSKDSDDAQIRITMPKTATVLALYDGTFRSHPTTFQIQRFHNNDPAEELQTYFKGEVASVTRQDDRAVALIVPIQEGDHEIPRYTFQYLCNSFLYESIGCTLLRTDFQFEATITSITQGTQITINGLRARAATLDAGVNGALSAGELDLYWQAGYLVTDGGEVREIMEGDVGGDPDTVRILQPFRDTIAGEAVTVFAGCDHTLDVCDRKFDNAANFQGFPFVPEVDPAHTELPPGSRSSPGNFAGFSS